MDAKPTGSAQSFLLLFRNAGPETHQHLSPSEREQLTQKWNDWYDSLAAQGKVQQGHPLQPQVRMVSGPRGKLVTDGPFAEATEAIGGYFFLTVANLAEATEIAQQCPGLEIGVRVEVRAIAEVSPVLEGVRGRAAAPR